LQICILRVGTMIMRLTPSALLITSAALVGLSAAGPVSALQQASTRQRSVVVSVLDRNDKPVANLTTKDFVVREDGVARELISVDAAPPPANVVLLVDDSQAIAAFPRDLRQALTTFADRLADAEPAPAVRLTTFGARPTVRVDFTPSFSGVSTAIDRITPATGSGAMLLEAIMETCRDLRTAKIDDAVIVTFLAESGPEFSTMSSRVVETALQSVRASLWTIVLQDTGAADTTTERRERASVVGDVTVRSGGRNKPVLAAQQLPQAFADLADVLLSRVRVTYGRPDTLIPPTRLEVTARDRAWRLQVSRWPAR
jgi:hypothetical protein